MHFGAKIAIQSGMYVQTVTISSIERALGRARARFTPKPSPAEVGARSRCGETGGVSHAKRKTDDDGRGQRKIEGEENKQTSSEMRGRGSRVRNGACAVQRAVGKEGGARLLIDLRFLKPSGLRQRTRENRGF